MSCRLAHRAFSGNGIDEARKPPIIAIPGRAKYLRGFDRQTIQLSSRLKRTLQDQMEGAWLPQVLLLHEGPVQTERESQAAANRHKMAARNDDLFAIGSCCDIALVFSRDPAIVPSAREFASNSRPSPPFCRISP